MDQALSYWTLARDQFPMVLSLMGNVVSALIIFVIGMIVGRWVQRRVRGTKVGGSHLDATLKPVLASVFFYIILAMTLYAVLIKLGVPPSAIIPIFGGAALAIALALKDTLSNIAAGLMLLFLRPVKVGEYVDLPNSSGTIQEIGLFSTSLTSPEGVYNFVPNSQVWSGRIQNFGRHTIRQFRLDIGVSYDTDLRQARAVIIDTLAAAKDRVLETAPTPPEAFVVNFGDSSVNFNCRVWLPGDAWFARTSELRIEIFEALGNANIEIPFPQRVVTMKKGD
jgi:small conductance mechanosensitive channel